MVKVGDRSSIVDNMIRLKEESAARTVLRDTAVEQEKALALREQQEASERERRKSERRDRFVNLKATLLKTEEEAARMALHDNRAEREKTVALRAKQHAEELANRDAERHDRFANLEATIRNAEEEAQRAVLIDNMQEYDKSVAMRAAQMANDRVRRDEEREDRFANLNATIQQIEDEAERAALRENVADREKTAQLKASQTAIDKALRELERGERFKDLHATIRKTEDDAVRAALRDNVTEREKAAQLKASQAASEKAVRESLRGDRFKDLHATIQKTEDEAERAALRDNAAEREKAAQLKVSQALSEKAMRVSLRGDRFKDLHATIQKTEDEAERAALRDNAVEREKAVQLKVSQALSEKAMRESLRDDRFKDFRATIRKTEDEAVRTALRDNVVEREKAAQIGGATTAREKVKCETERRRRRDESALAQHARVASEQSSRHELRSQTRSSHERAADDVEALRSRRAEELSASHASMRELREIRSAECSRTAAEERRDRDAAHSKSRAARQDALAARAAKQEALRARAAEIRQWKQDVQAAWG